MESTTNQLIPGLPDDIARDCLTRVPYTHFPSLRSVSRQWRDEVDSAVFHTTRKTNSLATRLLLLTHFHRNSTSTSLYDPKTSTLSTLPSPPRGLPLFCGLVYVQRKLVVVGGWHPGTWVSSNEVWVFNMASWTWSKGATMPGPRRTFFSCVADLDGVVVVAGGHDDDKNALRSAMKYDVVGDKWEKLPCMGMERDECKGVFRKGEFEIIGGYPTDGQGKFKRSSERLKLSEDGGLDWKVEERAVEEGRCSRNMVVVGGERLYGCWDGKVEREEGEGKWEVVAAVPEKMKNVTLMVEGWGEEEEAVVVFGNGGKHVGFVLEVEERRWRELEMVEGFPNWPVQSGCWLEI